MADSTTTGQYISIPLEEWMAALRVIAVARDIRDIQFGLLTRFPKSELIDTVDAFYELMEKNDAR